VDIKKYLQICVDIEKTAALVYRQMALSTHLPRELKVVLLNLADDEDAHSAQLSFASRFPPGTAIVGQSFDRATVEALLQRAKALLEVVSQQEFSARQVIETGIELEQDFCQAHIANSLELTDDSLKKMFAALAQDDEGHIQKLLNAKMSFL
jgi:rubrerythrin